MSIMLFIAVSGIAFGFALGAMVTETYKENVRP